ncbi:MAG: GntR family transcriptional regulator [Mycetocola sp.]
MDYFARRHHKARIVRDAIRSAVVERAWGSDALPQEDELSRQFGVGRNVIREALQFLVEEGMLTRQQGSGTRPTSQVLLHATESLRSLREGTGGDTGDADAILHRVLRWAEIPAAPLHASSLELEPGGSVIHLERLTYAAHPLIFWSTVMRADVGLAPPTEPGATTPEGFYSYLERSGLTLGRGTVRTGAVRADRGIAELLEVEAGSPVLLQHRRLLLQDGRPLEVSTGYFRPDQVSLVQVMNR